MNRYEQLMHGLCARLLDFRQGDSPVYISEVQMQDVERQLGEALPEDYREFVKEFGGFVCSAVFPLRTPEGSFESIEKFDAVVARRGSSRTIVSNYFERCGMDEKWREDLLPIGSDAGSNLVALAFKGASKGKIYFSLYSQLYEVADSFDEFMQLLTLPDDALEPEEKFIVAQDNELFWKLYRGNIG